MEGTVNSGLEIVLVYLVSQQSCCRVVVLVFVAPVHASGQTSGSQGINFTIIKSNLGGLLPCFCYLNSLPCVTQLRIIFNHRPALTTLEPPCFFMVTVYNTDNFSSGSERTTKRARPYHSLSGGTYNISLFRTIHNNNGVFAVRHTMWR